MLCVSPAAAAGRPARPIPALRPHESLGLL